MFTGTANIVSYTLCLHDALPILWWVRTEQGRLAEAMPSLREKLKTAENIIVESNSILKFLRPDLYLTVLDPATADRSEEHTSELQSRFDLVCRLLLENKNHLHAN